MFKLFKRKNKEDKVKKEDNQIDLSYSKYPNQKCALCDKLGCDKKWGGQYWHKKCLRNTRSSAKGMINK